MDEPNDVTLPADAEVNTNVGVDVVECVPDDFFCLVCGYNLRTLPYKGNCTECGTPVVRSVVLAERQAQRASLTDLPERVLRRSHVGITWLLTGFALASAVLVFNGLPAGNAWRNEPWWTTPDRLVVFVLIVAGWVCSCRGSMLLGGKFTRNGMLLLGGIWMIWPIVVAIANTGWQVAGLNTLVIFGWIFSTLLTGSVAVRLFDLARRADSAFGMAIFPLLALPLILVGTMGVYISVVTGGRPFNSMNLMTSLSPPMALPAGMFASVDGAASEALHRELPSLLLVSVSALVDAGLVAGLVLLRRAIGGVLLNGPAGAHRTSGASFRP